MISISHRALLGLVAAGALFSMPLLSTAIAAPKKKAPSKKAPAKPAKADAKKGKEQYKTEGCTGCHKTKDYQDAGEIGPDLSEIAKEHKAAEIAAYIKKPSKAGSIMPASKAPQATIDNITAYLMTQK
ncbi:MAG: c-type cytochrome [Armatimonadota bacterium]